MAQMDYVTSGQVVHIITHHSDLLSMYDLEGSTDGIPKYVMNELMCWELNLSSVHYCAKYSRRTKRVGSNALTMGKPNKLHSASEKSISSISFDGTIKLITRRRTKMAQR